nr:putative sulfiredoxin isoform X1 [Aedes albopictus]
MMKRATSLSPVNPILKKSRLDFGATLTSTTAAFTTNNNSNNDHRASEMNSVHTANIAEVHEMPMAVISRPIPPVLDDGKVQSLMQSIQVRSRFLFQLSWIQHLEVSLDLQGGSHN